MKQIITLYLFIVFTSFGWTQNFPMFENLEMSIAEIPTESPRLTEALGCF